MEILVSVVGKVAEYTVAPIGRKIGYFLFYDRNLKELQDHVKKLEGANEIMKHRVEEERWNTREIESDVENWLDMVTQEIEKAKQYQNDPGHAKVGCSGWLFPNCVSRHQLSRKATKLTKSIVVQLERYEKFPERVGYRTALDEVAFSSPTGGNKLKTREEIKESIVKALKDPTARIIGVYGMGGVGKTTLVKDVGAVAKKAKLFSRVVRAEGSEFPDIRKIQEEIAELLDLRFEEELTIAGRAYKLKKRIKAEKSILIILDNILATLDLEKVGIPSAYESSGCTRLDLGKVEFPFGDEGNRCKLLVTSRSELVLQEMHAQRDFTFKLELLNETEAWGLFQYNVGDDVVNDINLRDVATKVAERCGGLPLGIVTTARTLRNKDVYYWEDELRKLESVGHADIDAMIEFSYNRLDDEEMKEIFLLLAAVNGSTEYYLKLAIGLNIFKGINTVRDARNRLLTKITYLKSCCLLLESSPTGHIQMHDIVRKVANFIAYRENHVFVKKWPINESMTNCTQIILDKCHIRELPQRLDCPKIELFYLDSQNRSLEIPNTFFEGMGSLKVLDLTHLDLSLPTSIQSLTSLQVLCLDHCVLENMEVIGALKNLEILSLWGSSMNKLPSEIGKLGQLKMLDLSRSQIEIIPPNIISCLTKLEELKMGNASIKWEDGNSLDQNTNASFVELQQLSNLTSLELQVGEAWVLLRDLQLVFGKLKRYKIAIGDEWKWSQIENETLKTLMLKIPSDKHLVHRIKALIKDVEILFLDEIDGIENVLYQLNAEGFPLLKKLYIQNNANMKHIVDTVNRDPRRAFFINLERLVLENLRNLEQICHGQLATNSFCRLGVIQVKDCVQLKYLLSFSMLKELSQLFEIQVSQCDSMKGIMLRDSNSSAAKDITNELNEFLSLRSLTLDHLLALDNFISDESMPSITERKNQGPNSCVETPFFSAQVVFPKLDALKLRSLSMNKIWNENQQSMNNLTSLIVENCGGLKYLLSSTMVESFKSLKRLEISKCDLMEEIIATENRNNGTFAVKEGQFSKLETIILKDMKVLKTIWHCHFDNTVKTLQVANCDKIVVVFPTTGKKTYRNLETLEVMDCASVEEIFELTSSESSSIEVTMHLKEITLETLPKLKKIWSMDPQGILCFSNLENVQLHECEILEYLFPYSVATCCSHLEKLSIHVCRNMKVIVAEKIESTCTTPIFQLDQLSILFLCSLDKLKGFYAGNHTLECPSLIRIDVRNCAKLNLFRASSTSNLERLGEQKLRVSMQQPPFIIEEVIPNLEHLRINNRDADMILQAQNLDTLFPKIKFLGLNSYTSEGATFPYWFLQNMPTLEWLHVERCSFEKIFKDERVVVSEKFHTRLKKLDLHQLPKLEHICKEGYRIDPVLELLECLHVGDCPSLKTLLPSSATFNHLIHLEITNCSGLICLISSSTARSLVMLKEMQVKDCDSLEEIIKGEENVDIAFTSLEILKLKCLPRLNKFCSSKSLLKFPLLEEVVVRECPRMKIFSKGNTSAPNLRKIRIDEENYKEWRLNGNLNDTVKKMFEDKVAFCKIKSLTLSDYPELKDLWYAAQPHDNVFSNLKSLVVQRCDFLSDVLFPSNMLQVLHGLEEVEVSECDSLEAVFDVKGTRSEEILIKQSNGLKRLTLARLPKLKQIWNDDPYDIISFEKLCTVNVSGCPSLLYIFPSSLCHDLGHLETLTIKCSGVEEIVATMEERSRTTNIFKFPLLSHVRLSHLIKLKRFYREKHTLECPSLKILDVYHCEALRMFSFNHFDLQQPDSTNVGQALFPFEMLSPNLEELTISGTDATTLLKGFAQENILHEIKALNLECFDETPTNFLNHSHAIFPNLVTIKVRRSSFEILFPTKGTGTTGHLSQKISKQIRNLWLIQLKKLKYIWEDDPLLQDLETLSVLACPSLISLVPPSTSFTNLTKLQVGDCNKLVYLITSSTAKSLVQLTALAISNCEMMLDVVKIIDEQNAEEEDIIFQNLEFMELSSLSSLRSFCYNGKHRFMFPSLLYLRVKGCPQMEIFSSGVAIAPDLTSIEVENERKYWKGDLNTTIQHLFIEKVAFCNIKSLTLSKYPELKDLWYGQPHENMFRNLKSLVVERCDFLSHLLFPSNLLQVLHGLEEVEVRDCDSLEALFDVKGMKSEEKLIKRSSGLKRLTLSGLPKLKQIWNDDPYDIISFKNLCSVDVSECQSLLYIFPLSICQDLGQLENLEIESCGVEEIVAAAMEEEGSIMKCSFSFPQLTKFRLRKLMNLKNFYPGKHTLECPSLKILNVYCGQALRLFSFNDQVDEIHDTPFQQALFSIDKLSPNLDEISLSGSDVWRILNGCCGEMILHKVKFLHLQCFDETPAANFLKHFHAIFPSLVMLQVRNSSFETLFPTKGHLSMQISKQIRNLFFYELEKLKFIWEEDFPLTDPSLQELEDLIVWECPSLISLVPSLTSFTKLTKLNVNKCKKLVYLITSSTAKSLVQLTSLVISNCEMILDVVKTIDEQEAEEEDIIFKNLEYLEFISMSSLRSFCYNGKHRFMFPSLTYLLVEECPQMEIFSSGVTIAPYLTSILVENKRERWKGDLNTTIQHLFIENKEVSHPEDK